MASLLAVGVVRSRASAWEHSLSIYIYEATGLFILGSIMGE